MLGGMKVLNGISIPDWNRKNKAISTKTDPKAVESSCFSLFKPNLHSEAIPAKVPNTNAINNAIGKIILNRF